VQYVCQQCSGETDVLGEQLNQGWDIQGCGSLSNKKEGTVDTPRMDLKGILLSEKSPFPLLNLLQYSLFLFWLFWLGGMWDLRSPTRD